MSLKRDYIKYLGNCGSIGSGNTLVTVIVVRINPPKDRNNPRSPYSLTCTAMVNKPTLVRFAVKKGEEQAKREKHDIEAIDGIDATGLGGLLKPGDTFVSNVFDRPGCTNLTEGSIVDLACNASVYTNDEGVSRVTYKSDKVMFKNESSALCKSSYDRYIAGTSLARIPTRFNLRAEDFPGETNEKFMTARFVAPLFNDGVSFQEVVPVIEDNVNSMVCKRDDREYVGFSTNDGDRASNSFGVVYRHHATEEDPSPKPIMLKLTYLPSVWTSFGIDDVELWKPVAHRIMSNLQGAYFFAFSSVESIHNMKSNVGYDENGEEEDSDVIYSTAFCTKFNLDMIETVKKCGVKLDSSHVEQIMDERKYDREYQPYGSTPDVHPKHPLNNGFRAKLERNVRSIYNISEINSDDIGKFFKSAANCGFLSYWGIFKEDAVYEYDGDDVTSFVNENGYTPSIIFAINEV